MWYALRNLALTVLALAAGTSSLMLGFLWVVMHL